MRKFFTLILFMGSLSLLAQQVKVISKSDLQPIAGCQVFNADKSIMITTGNDGIADISTFKANDVISFSHLSFVSQSIDKKVLNQSVNTITLEYAVINLNEFVFSANKVKEKYTDLPMKVDIIPARKIQLGNPQTSGELLQQNGTVFLQQSQLGGGSAVIRGMETNRVLMVVDGVRLNNAVYRAGHIQNVITVDPNMLSRIEIVHGPGSVIYGSDAMGGVIHFYSRNPVLSTNDKVFTTGNVMLRYASASSEYSQSFFMNVGGNKIAALFGGSTKSVGDLREGSNRDDKYGDWGKCLYYAQRINGQDVMTENDDPLVQKNSGYNQYDLFAKILLKTTENHSLTLNTQFSNSSNIPRYDRLTEYSGEKLKYAEWYYGPQTRGLISLKSEWTNKTAFFDNATALAAYQYISEDRISRSFGKSSKKHQEETVEVYSLNVDFLKKISKHELRYGIEAMLDKVGSKAYSENIKTGELLNTVASRYPDGGNDMKYFAAYASNHWEINDKLIFSQGLRFNLVKLNAKYTQAMMDLLKFPFDAEIKQDNTAINGNLGLVYMPGNDWRFAVNVSTGFRAPNIDDLTKLNDSNSTDQLIIVPNPDLKPENAYNAELTIGKTFAKKVQVELTGFYTLLSDAFVVKASTFNGQDSIYFDEKLSAVNSMQNVDKATIYGVEANVVAELYKNLSLRSSITYTYGHIKDDDVPLDHIPPVFGITSLTYELSKFTAEFYSRYNGWKHIEDYSPSGEDNEAYATADGMPSWFTLNLKAGYQITRNFNLQAGIENLLDKHYRNFASGISAPGRNIFVTLRATL